MCKALTYDVTVKRSRVREKNPSRSFQVSANGSRHFVHAYPFLLTIFLAAVFILSIAGSSIAKMAELERSNDAKWAAQMKKMSEYSA